MTAESCLQALDGLMAAYHNGADIELGLASLVKLGVSLPQLVRFADLRGFKKIASTGRRMIRKQTEDSKEISDAQKR